MAKEAGLARSGVAPAGSCAAVICAAAIAEAQRVEHAEAHIETGLLPASVREALRTRVILHGIAANRKVVETAAHYSFEQGLTPRPLRLGDVFAGSRIGI